MNCVLKQGLAATNSVKEPSKAPRLLQQYVRGPLSEYVGKCNRPEHITTQIYESICSCAALAALSDQGLYSAGKGEPTPVARAILLTSM